MVLSAIPGERTGLGIKADLTVKCPKQLCLYEYGNQKGVFI